VANLAGRHELGHRTDGLLDRHIRVDAVLVVEVDLVDGKPAQAVVAGRADVFRTPVDAALVACQSLPNLVASTT